MAAPDTLPSLLPTPVFVIGDAHLGAAPPAAERALLAWLRHVRAEATSVLIMGDLFDFWFAWKHVMPRQGYRVLAALADLTEAGMPVLWIGGNHDCWSGDALEAETGVRYSLAPWSGIIGHWRAELAHGDGLREREDAPYRRLRRVLRHPLSARAFGWLHPDWASRLALTSSQTSRDMRAGDEGRALLDVATQRLSAADGPDLIVHGHTHVPRLERAGRGVYANSGAWYMDTRYLRIDSNSVSMLQWDASGEGHVLDTIDRVPEEAPAQR